MTWVRVGRTSLLKPAIHGPRRLTESEKLASRKPRARRFEGSLAVGNPDVLHLNSVLEEPAAFALFGIKPVDRTAFVRKRLL